MSARGPCSLPRRPHAAHVVVMTDSLAGPAPAPASGPARQTTPRGLGPVLAVAAVMLAVVVGLIIGFGAGLFHPNESRALPEFGSLSEQPDTSLHGTVAFFAADTGCVRIVAASGLSARNALCISAADLAVKPELGIKPAGPQLVWLPDGRLQVTMFLWRPQPGAPVYSAGWQKIVDVATGKVDIVPTSQVPSTPNTSTESSVNPQGDRAADASGRDSSCRPARARLLGP